MLRSLRRFAAIARTPVLPESAALHARNWARVPGEMRTPHQMLGRQGNGCGATIGAMPRCDFACRGCYLGEGANRIPAEPVEAIKAQMRQLRPSLGASGNLQLTDGEITLRPDDEVIELIRYARELELIPMLMTHGDSFRRRPGLLERYMTEGGLSEVSIHVDTTQRGRTGAAYKRAESEDALNPLRDEFARMIRHARRDTGLPLRAATTVTVTRDNLAGIPDVTRWVARNSDAFRMISFQPVAQVGRTEERLGAITVDELWAHIAEALYGSAAAVARLERGAKWLGHPACNRIVHGVIVRHGGDEPAFHPIRETGDATDEEIVDGFLRRFGGISFRQDSAAEAATRFLGVFASAPAFIGRSIPRFAWHWLRRASQGRPLPFLARLLAGRARLDYLVIVSHHFMSRAEIEAPLGRERLALCVFHVPVDGELVSMCEVNALGVRDRYYEEIAAGR